MACSKLTLGTRGSALALIQAHWVRDQIRAKFPEVEISTKVVKVAADRNPEVPIRDGATTGVFVKEIEEALVTGKIDLAVHSMKDMPTRIESSLEINVIPVREDPRDALITGTEVRSLKDLPEEAIVGTGSLRRKAQILLLRPDLKVRDIRGNVDTRLKKLGNGSFHAIILACAGLKRLGIEDRISLPLAPHEMLPAPGQGALALQIRKSDSRISDLIHFLNHSATATAVLAERAFMRRLGGGCNSPIAVHANLDQGFRIEGLVATPDGTEVVRKSFVETSHLKAKLAEDAAVELAEKILSSGGGAILESLN